MQQGPNRTFAKTVMQKHTSPMTVHFNMTHILSCKTVIDLQECILTLQIHWLSYRQQFFKLRIHDLMSLYVEQSS